MEQRVRQIFGAQEVEKVGDRLYITKHGKYHVKVEILEHKGLYEITIYGKQIQNEDVSEQLLEELKFIFADITCTVEKESILVQIPMI